MSPQTSKSNSDETNDLSKKEYEALLSVFQEFVDTTSNSFDVFEILEKLAELRADFVINHAIRGFGMDFETALNLVNNYDLLTDAEKERRGILLAAIENLIDFAVVQEYQALSEIVAIMSEEDEDEEDEEDRTEESLKVFERYNSRYALIENKDIIFAMGIAAAWSSQKNETLITYLTMGDERVRPWHQDLDGLTFPKSEFPSWMIPPIEHSCRCHLNYDHSGTRTVSDRSVIKTPPDWINPTFQESVAKGGRIFSEHHPYFTVKSEHYASLQQISGRIKSNYLSI